MKKEDEYDASGMKLVADLMGQSAHQLDGMTERYLKDDEESDHEDGEA